MTNPTAAMLVIGDEILSGRTRDSNMYHLAGELTNAGIDLKEVRVVGDERGTITRRCRRCPMRMTMSLPLAVLAPLMMTSPPIASRRL